MRREEHGGGSVERLGRKIKDRGKLNMEPVLVSLGPPQYKTVYLMPCICSKVLEDRGAGNQWKRLASRQLIYYFGK